ncbi:MAG TPA: PQQ-binding-like beta-propeller repeat protein [Ktedonobacterales bacterium]
MAGKKVFICAAAEDAGYYGEIVTALDAWEVPHTELGVMPGPVTSLPDTIQQAIRDCEVFLRLCTTHTRQSDAVNLATASFQQLLQQEHGKGRRLVNLIFDQAYPLDDDEKKRLYIMAPGKARARWLEDLAVSVGAATLTQQLSRRALLGMGVGAALTLASGGVAGTLLVRQARAPQQEPLLPVRAKISGNPRFSFALSDKPAHSSYPAILQDGATVYAQPDLENDTSTSPDSSVYVLSAGSQKQRRISIESEPAVPRLNPVQSKLVAATNGILFLFSNPGGVFGPSQTSALIAVSVRDGGPIWKVTTALAGRPVLSDGVVYCVLQDVTKIEANAINYQTSLNALSLQDGSRLWRTTEYSFDTILTPAVSGGRLYIGSYLDQDHNIYCLDAKTGKKLWSYLTGGAVLGTPVIANGTVYVGSEDGYLYALDAYTGALGWRFASSVSFYAPPLIRDGVVFAPSQDAYLYALDARSGAMYWRAYMGVNPNRDNLDIRSSEANPVAVYRNVVFATLYGGLYAFDMRDGSQRWRYIPVEEDLNTISPPVISDGMVLVGASDNHVYAVNP